jgi:hypothetical protein
MDDFKLTFISHNRKAQCAPNPEYPNGIVVDTGKRPACSVDLPYPADCVGAWMVKCNKCGTVAAVTTAGRPDDPKTLFIPCRKATG